MRDLVLRRRLVLAALLSVGVGLALLLLAFNLLLARSLSRDADALLRSRAEAQLATVSAETGRLTVEETPGDGVLDQSAWVFEGARGVSRAPGPPELQRAVRALARVTGPTFRDAGTDTRLLAVPAFGTDGHKRLGTVVVSVSRIPYEQSERAALISSLVLGAFLLAATALIARRSVSVALRPVAEMTRQAEDWSEHDLDRRFGLGPPRDELTQLAATLDGLLDRLAASLRHERRFSAEMAHELRTPLAGTRAAADLALRHDRPPEELRSALRDVVRGADRIADVVDALVAAARAQVGSGLGTSDALDGVRAAVEQTSPDGVQVSIDAGRLRVILGVDAAHVERIVAPVLENAIRYGRSQVTVRIRGVASAAVITVSDDGPGFAPDEAERVFDPGIRGTAAEGADGAGLGLTLARRLAQAAGGDVRVAPAGVEIRLPIAHLTAVSSTARTVLPVRQDDQGVDRST